MRKAQLQLRRNASILKVVRNVLQSAKVLKSLTLLINIFIQVGHMRQRGRDIPDENEDDILYNVDYFEKTSR